MAVRFAAYIDPEPGALVERFSWEVETRERTVADTDEFDQLRLDFIAERERRASERRRDNGWTGANPGATSSEDAIILNKAKQQLLQSMKQFQDLVPSHLKTNELPTSWDEVWSVATEVQAQWDSKRTESHVSRAKDWFRKMCNGMNNHATALKMLPSESEYVSLISGSVSMIIKKASANHINISESFAKGIVDINDAVDLEHLSHVYDNPIFQELTMRLYTQIFTYLIRFMTWFTERSRNRFLRSFNENNHRIFEEELAQVRQTSGLLTTRIQLYMSADVRASKILMEDLSGNMDYLLKFSEARERRSRIQDAANAELIQGLLRRQFEKSTEEFRDSLAGMMNDYHEILRSGISGGGITGLLQQQASHDMQKAPRASAVHGQSNSDIILVSERSGERTTQSPSKASDGSDIRFESRHLENYFSWDHVHTAYDSSMPLLAEANFMGRLNSFTTVMKSQILYAHGQYQVEATSLLRQSAMAYVSLARNAGVPVISYFCELSNDEPLAQRTRESIELSALLNAMIRQLVNILPTEPVSAAAFPEASRFSELDGTLCTWQEAISVFEDLVRCVSLPLLLFVVDGINVLEDDFEATTTDQLQSLVRCLKNLAKPSALGDGNMVKVLFTSAGLSDTLYQVLDEEHIMFCDNSSPGASGFRRARRVMFY